MLDVVENGDCDGRVGDPTPAVLRPIAAIAARQCRAALAIVSVIDEDDDAQSLANPLVAGARGYGIFATEPLVSSSGSHLGTLRLLDHEPRELSEDEARTLREVALVIADHLQLRATTAAAQRTADQLQDALLSNRTIGKALGLMMAQYHLDDEAAFDKLRDHSRDLNLKIRDLAERIVAHHNSGTRPAE